MNIRILLHNMIYNNPSYCEVRSYYRKEVLQTAVLGAMWNCSMHTEEYTWGVFSGNEFTELENSVLVF